MKNTDTISAELTHKDIVIIVLALRNTIVKMKHEGRKHSETYTHMKIREQRFAELLQQAEETA